MHFRCCPALPTVLGYGTHEGSKVRPSLPLGAASSRRATPQPSGPVFIPVSSGGTGAGGSRLTTDLMVPDGTREKVLMQPRVSRSQNS